MSLVLGSVLFPDFGGPSPSSICLLSHALKVELFINPTLLRPRHSPELTMFSNLCDLGVVACCPVWSLFSNSGTLFLWPSKGSFCKRGSPYHHQVSSTELSPSHALLQGSPAEGFCNLWSQSIFSAHQRNKKDSASFSSFVQRELCSLLEDTPAFDFLTFRSCPCDRESR